MFAEPGGRQILGKFPTPDFRHQISTSRIDIHTTQMAAAAVDESKPDRNRRQKPDFGGQKKVA
ncbi:hypothetical protein [Syntrophaceticus schinkii]|jgi:hypothetical protein|uniref:hypothetical protein n=1 Tax=Syntrophaceticus schinkii TaxID=499207 RepID=UPI0005CC4C9A|nr:hypothetical protein [Syntrophaceticus schinkii]